jgi:hypothetical protein
MLRRGLCLKCPACGRESIFTGWFAMHSSCPACGLRYGREPGYFLGSIYINYGVTALMTTIGFVWLRFGLEVEGPPLLIGFSAYCLLFPIVFFRHARALWLVMDCVLDSSALEDRVDVKDS